MHDLTTEQTTTHMENSLTPRAIVAELDRHIVGQDAAKRSVAIAIRNRWRRQRLDEEMQNEVAPKNILMIGPTGVGKTEIARRLATLTGAPFIKVEATKYTEVGYYGRDVESMVRELVENAIGIVRDSELKSVESEDQYGRHLALPIDISMIMGRVGGLWPHWPGRLTGSAAPVQSWRGF